jgi:hypothetical protein
MSVSLNTIIGTFTTLRGTPTRLSHLIKNGTYVKTNDNNVNNVPTGLPIQLSQFKNNSDIASPAAIGYLTLQSWWLNRDYVNGGSVEVTWFFDGGIYNITQWKLDRQQELINEFNDRANSYEQEWQEWSTDGWPDPQWYDHTDPNDYYNANNLLDSIKDRRIIRYCWRFVAGWQNNNFVRAGDVDRNWLFDGDNFSQWKIDREQELINQINSNANFYEEQWNSWLGSSWT